MAERVQQLLQRFSEEDLDELVKTSSFKGELEEAIHAHVHVQLQTWFFYRKLSADCSRTNIALHGFAALWKRAASDRLSDATWLEAYLVQRGGRSQPADIPAPSVHWPDGPVDPVEPVHEALQAEKRLLEDLQRLCAAAERCGDIALRDVIETRFLRRKTRHVKDMADLLRQCVRVSKAVGYGIYHLDRELRAGGGVPPWGPLNEPDAADDILHESTEDLYKSSM
jgi:ferritin heavy chain